MFFKFISSTEIKPYSKGFIVFDGRIYTNPKEEQLKMAGYKPLISSDKPEFDVATQCLTVTYKDTDEAIVEEYAVVDLPEVRDDV